MPADWPRCVDLLGDVGNTHRQHAAQACASAACARRAQLHYHPARPCSCACCCSCCESEVVVGMQLGNMMDCARHPPLPALARAAIGDGRCGGGVELLLPVALVALPVTLVRLQQQQWCAESARRGGGGGTGAVVSACRRACAFRVATPPPPLRRAPCCRAPAAATAARSHAQCWGAAEARSCTPRPPFSGKPAMPAIAETCAPPAPLYARGVLGGCREGRVAR